MKRNIIIIILIIIFIFKKNFNNIKEKFTERENEILLEQTYKLQQYLPNIKNNININKNINLDNSKIKNLKLNNIKKQNGDILSVKNYIISNL
jgi:hypothetical protein